MSVTRTRNVRVPSEVRAAVAYGWCPLNSSNVPLPSRSQSNRARPLSSEESLALRYSEVPIGAAAGSGWSSARGRRWIFRLREVTAVAPCVCTSPVSIAPPAVSRTGAP